MRRLNAGWLDNVSAAVQFRSAEAGTPGAGDTHQHSAAAGRGNLRIGGPVGRRMNANTREGGLGVEGVDH